MLRNACVGEHIFYRFPAIDENGRHSIKCHSFVVDREDIEDPSKRVHIDGCIIPEDKLNSLGRFIERVWAESELQTHEIEYMLQNSEPKGFS